MADYTFPEYRQVVEEIVKGTRTRNRVPQRVELGNTVTFFSARPVNPPHDAHESTPDDNPISVVVHVSKVDTGPSLQHPYFIEWDALSTASHGG